MSPPAERSSQLRRGLVVLRQGMRQSACPPAERTDGVGRPEFLPGAGARLQKVKRP